MSTPANNYRPWWVPIIVIENAKKGIFTGQY